MHTLTLTHTEGTPPYPHGLNLQVLPFRFCTSLFPGVPVPDQSPLALSLYGFSLVVQVSCHSDITMLSPSGYRLTLKPTIFEWGVSVKA